MKVPAMVIYPSFGAYINYCYGFSLIDLPIFDNYFSSVLTNTADQTPASFQMFYNNINFASSYLLPFLIFVAIMIPLNLFSIFKEYQIGKANKNIKKAKIKNYKDLTGD